MRYRRRTFRRRSRSFRGGRTRKQRKVYVSRGGIRL